MEVLDLKNACKNRDAIENATRNGICEQLSRYFESEASAFLLGTGAEDDVGAEVGDMSWPTTFTTTCLVLRNLCSCDENCEYFQERGIFVHLKTVIRRLSMLSSSRLGADKKRKEELKKISNYMVQCVSNVAACGVVHLSHAIVDDVVRDMIALSTKHQSRSALAASLSGLYNSIVNPEISMPLRIEVICSNRSLWCQLMLSSIAGIEDEEDVDPAWEWFGYLIEKLIEFGYSCKVLALVGPNHGSVWGIDDRESNTDSGTGEPQRSFVTHEQIVLLRMMVELWEGEKYLNALSPSSSRQSLWVPEDIRVTVLYLARFLQSLTSMLAVEGNDRTDTAVDTFSEQDDVVQATLSYGALITLLDALAACLSWRYYQDISHGCALRESLENDGGIVKSILTILTYTSDAEKSMFGRFELTTQEKANLQRAALRALGNAIYLSKVVQDAFRLQDGFAVVLPLCATNLEVPLAREWALLAMRNALEGNSENQDYVSSLRPQGEAFVQDEVLKEANLSVVFDQASNKFKMKKML